MSTLIYLIFMVAVAAFIGGVTNHLAIKMLFHPRTVWRVGRYRVPFTPGLIPKRREEIAESLGRVVADYLVTSHGLGRMLRKPEFRERLASGALAWLNRWMRDESTVAERFVQMRGGGEALAYRERLEGWLESAAIGGVDYLWRDADMQNKTLETIIPGWSEEKKTRWSAAASEFLLREIGRLLNGLEGQRLIAEMVQQFTQQAGGFFGALAGMFMDERRIVGKVQAALLQALLSPSARASLQGMVQGRLTEWEAVPLAEWGAHLGAESDLAEMAKSALAESRPWRGWAERIWLAPIGPALERFRPELERALPAVLDTALDVLERNVERILQAVRLPELVQDQVRDFPVERLEQIILSVSGKEFRAITWLGVLLGGFIGLLQSLLAVWLR